MLLFRPDARPGARFHVLIACHNRRELTAGSITAFATAAKAAGAEVDFTVFDDGSTDGTADALAVLDLPVTRIAGDGSAFWSRSMAEAEGHVLRTYDDGYVVWLNDDVDLDADFLEVVLAAAKTAPSAVLVGAMRDPATGELTYSGQIRGGFHPLNYSPVRPNGRLQAVHTFNGNLVFVPMEVARVVDGIDGSLPHTGADIDYGIRVRRKHFEVLLLPRFVGSCALNPVPPFGPVMDDWRAFVGERSGGNFKTMKRLLEKRHPHTWLAYVISSYLLWWARRLLRVRIAASEKGVSR